MIEDTVIFSIRLSLKVAILSTLLVSTAGIIVAYFLATKQFKGKEIIDIIFTLPLVLPPTVTGYYLVILFGRNGILGSIIYKYTGFSLMFTWYAAVLASFVVSLPLMIKTTRSAIESIDINLIEASYTLGNSKTTTALKVIFPLAKKGIMVGIVLSFARSMGEFGATLMLAGNIPGKTNTLPITVYTLANSGEWPKANFIVLLLTLISGSLIYIANKYSRK